MIRDERDLYEGGIKTSFIAYWRGKIAAGKTSNYLGAFWDIMPTMVELAKADNPKKVMELRRLIEKAHVESTIFPLMFLL